jgi:hypothetical protein
MSANQTNRRRIVTTTTTRTTTMNREKKENSKIDMTLNNGYKVSEYPQEQKNQSERTEQKESTHGERGGTETTLTISS